MSTRRLVAPSHRLDVALAGLLLAVVAPFVQTLTAQGGARYSLTAAIVEQGTVRLDDYSKTVGIDRVEIDGHVYSDKAPAQPWLGVPVLAVAEALGAEPATKGRLSGNLGLWSQTLVFCTLPAAALLVLMRRNAARTEPHRFALLAALALAFGTMLLPFASALYGHMLAATFGFAAWHLVSRPRPSAAAVACAGGLAALAVATEYPLALGAFVVGCHVLYRCGLRRAVVYALPLMLAGLALAAYNSAVYGTAGSSYAKKGDTSAITLPKLDNIIDMLVGAKGFVFTPIVIVALITLAVSVPRRRDLVVPAAVAVLYFGLQAGWPNPWGGGGPGPRYATPMIPFLVVPAAIGLASIRRAFRLPIIAVGVVSMTLVIVTYELAGQLVIGHLENIRDAGMSPTIYTMAIGPAGWVVHAATIAAAAFHLHRTAAESPDDTTSRLEPTVAH